MSRLLAALIVLAAPLLARGDWPQWRGRDRDGHTHGARLPRKWPEKASRPLWKQAVGEGQSSPVVARGRLFVLGRENGKEMCWCLDADSGKVRWQRGYDCVYKPADASAGQGPKSTPTVDGDRVYLLGVAGLLHCLAVTDGAVLWKRDLLREFWGVAKDKWGDDAYSTCCGAAAAPLVDGPRVLLPVGGKKAGAVTAFDRRTGQVVWKSPLPDRSSYGSGVIATLAGRRQVVGFTGLRMVGVTTDGGKLLWEYPFPAQYEQTMLTPVVWKDRVIVGGEEKPTVALEVRSTGGKMTAQVAWSNPRLRAYLTSPVAVRDHLYGLSKRGDLVCVSLADGKTAWSAPGFSTFGTVVAAGDVLLVLTKHGELHVIAANPRKLTRLARWQGVGEDPVWSQPCLVGGRLYVKDRTHVLCYDLAD
jgi:outer membrane protein assembly factor BamB